MQTDWAMHLQPNLESESNITKTANRALTAVHDHNGNGPDMLLAAVGLVERIWTGVSLQDQAAAGVLPPSGIRHDHSLAATVLGHGQRHCFLAWHPLPLNIPISGVELGFLVEEDFVRQGWKGDIVAPAQGHLDLPH